MACRLGIAEDGAGVPIAERPTRAEEESSSTAGGEGSLKLTVQSVIMAFVFAFMFRTYLVEPFMIPTGSMAPTLLGAHVRAHGPSTGWSWAVAARDYADRAEERPRRMQGDAARPLRLVDPMARTRVELAGTPLRAGDRIATHKYLFNLLDPERWDVVVFRNPAAPGGNYIKRVVGLPGERIQLVDGDVFAGRAEELDRPLSIRRKPLEIQEHLWIPLHTTAHQSPAEGATAWRAASGRGLADLPITLTRGEVIRWNPMATEDDPSDAVWPIDDWLFFNDTPALRSTRTRYPVSDLRLTASVSMSMDPAPIRLVIEARGHVFSARIAEGRAELSIHGAGGEAGAVSKSVRLEAGQVFAEAGRPVRLELWHVDQALHLFVDGQRLASLEYEWDPLERLSWALREMRAARGGSDGGAPAGKPPAAQEGRVESDGEGEAAREGIPAGSGGDGGQGRPPLPGGGGERDEETARRAVPPGAVPPGEDSGGDLAERAREPGNLRRARVWVELGAPVRVHGLGLDRDLYHQPVGRTGPLSLGAGEHFVLGDNSAASSDSRLWESVDPWVARRFGGERGVVDRELIMGKAFFVYFPGPHRDLRIPIPDFGRMRWIR